MLVLSLIASLMFVGGTSYDPTNPQNNAQNGRFVVTHQPGAGEILADCVYGTPMGDKRSCMMMNSERVNKNVRLELRFDDNIDMSQIDVNAKYVVWLQKNDSACRYEPNDANRTVHLVSATAKSLAKTYSGNVLLAPRRIELDTADIMRETAPNMPLTRWQICIGINPQNGADIDAAKNHPTGGLVFNIGTAKPVAPELTGITPRHERLTATVLLPQPAMENTARLTLRAIPRRLAAQVTPPDHDHDPNYTPPAIYACPEANNDYHNLLVTAEICPRDIKYKSQVDKSDNKLHASIELPSIPDETYIVCAYSFDKVSNVSDASGPHTGQSYRASDTFAALQPDHLATGHGCANLDASLASCAAAGIAWLAGRLTLQRRGRKTRP